MDAFHADVNSDYHYLSGDQDCANILRCLRIHSREDFVNFVVGIKNYPEFFDIFRDNLFTSRDFRNGAVMTFLVSVQTLAEQYHGESFSSTRSS